MFIPSVDELMTQTQNFLGSYVKDSRITIDYKEYIRDTFNKRYQDKPLPREIKLPPSYEDMLQGSMEPSRILVVEEQPEWDGIPLWRGVSTNGIYLTGYGLLNGRRDLPSTEQISDTFIHSFSNGDTGQGKSVLDNAKVQGICLEYPPWEVQFFMLDGKAIEYGALINLPQIPHFRAIAATNDSDFMVCVLLEAEKEMQIRNDMFNKYPGVKSIMDFRKYTGFTFPRVIINWDEVEATFGAANSRQKAIMENCVDALARKGRSAGIHLQLTSQGLSGQLPAATLSQIKVRGALGCSASDSEKIIGNPAASAYVGIKGRFIYNPTPPPKEGSNIGANKHYVVPFINESLLPELCELQNKVGKTFNYFCDLSVYDESTTPTMEQQIERCRLRKDNNNTIFLGDPSRIVKGDDPVAKIVFSDPMVEPRGSDNIYTLSNNPDTLVRILEGVLLSLSEREKEGDLHSVLYTDYLYKRLDFSKVNCQWYRMVESVDDDYYRGALGKYAIRKLLTEVDQLVFDNNLAYDRSADNLQKCWGVYDSLAQENTVFLTDIYKSRFYHVIQVMMTNDSLQQTYGCNDLNSLEGLLDSDTGRSFLQIYHHLDCDNIKLNISKFPISYVWLLGTKDLLGIGTSSKSKEVEALKNALRESTKYNIRWILSSLSLENHNELVDSTNHILSSNMSSKLISSIKLQDYYPAENKKLHNYFNMRLPEDFIRYKTFNKRGEVSL